MDSEEVSSTVTNCSKNMLLAEAELGAVFQHTELPRLYMGLVLQHDPKYGEFVAGLFRCHVVRFDLKALRECGLFFVAKNPKDGKVRLRLVIDARISNRLFRKPPWCPLSSGENLACMEIKKGQACTAQEDV